MEARDRGRIGLLGRIDVVDFVGKRHREPGQTVQGRDGPRPPGLDRRKIGAAQGLQEVETLVERLLERGFGHLERVELGALLEQGGELKARVPHERRTRRDGSLVSRGLDLFLAMNRSGRARGADLAVHGFGRIEILVVQKQIRQARAALGVQLA